MHSGEGGMGGLVSKAVMFPLASEEPSLGAATVKEQGRRKERQTDRQSAGRSPSGSGT